MLPGYDKEHTTDTQVSQQNIHPDIRREDSGRRRRLEVCTIGLAVQILIPSVIKGLEKSMTFSRT